MVCMCILECVCARLCACVYVGVQKPESGTTGSSFGKYKGSNAIEETRVDPQLYFLFFCYR